MRKIEISDRLEADRQYEAALCEHHRTGDLRLALELYREIIDTFPNTLEAESARLQILKIVEVVVPGPRLLDMLLELACAHLETDAQDPKKDDSAKLRRLRDEQDEAWDKAQRERRKVEIKRRVMEQWRGPFT